MDAISGIFLGALGTDMTAMEEYFPFITMAFSIMQYTAWALLFIITVWQLFRTFGGPITEAENPWHLLVRSTLFAVMIGFSKPIFSIALDIARAPYTALMDASMNPGNFTFAGVENVLVSGLITLVSTITVVGLLLQIILMIALGWNYFKLLLEVVERYIVVGVLCYTSPLAFTMGGAKATNKVFQSWCRMVGSQLLLLVMNVWFLRAFNSSVGYFVANGGALSSGHGNIFLWLFCALAFLKTAQKFDSYLASLGLSVAQTGSGMGMEMMMGLRMLTGFAGGARSAGSVFKGGPAAGTTAGAAGATGGFMAGLASKFRGNSYVRDAVVDGGARMGAGGSIGFVGRAFGGMAARGGTELTGSSISSVAARPSAVSGSIAGEIADRSLKNYMPHMAPAMPGGASSPGMPVQGGARLSGSGTPGSHAGTISAAAARSAPAPGAYGHSAPGASSAAPAYAGAPPPGVKYSGTQITGGHIGTTAVLSDGRTASVDLYSASQFDRPGTPHSVVTASDGSQWYQIASGEGMGAFYGTPQFTGDASESAQVAATFPSAPEGTSLRTVDDGVIEASHPDGGSSLWLNSAHYQEPDAPHDTVYGADGVGWYAMHPHAAAPDFETGAAAYPDYGGISGTGGHDRYGDAYADHSEAQRVGGSGTGYGGTGETSQGGAASADYSSAGGGLSEAAMDYNRAQFRQFMPGYETTVSQVDASRRADGMIEVRHADGTGTAFYDKTQYQAPRGDHKVYEDSRGSQWYAVPGTPTVERRPVYEDGKAVYDGETLRTTNVESVRYKTMLTRFEEPKKRDVNDRKPPNPKRR